MDLPPSDRKMDESNDSQCIRKVFSFTIEQKLNHVDSSRQVVQEFCRNTCTIFIVLTSKNSKRANNLRIRTLQTRKIVFRKEQ